MDDVLVSVRRVCEHLGIDYPTQTVKLKEKAWACVGLIPIHDTTGRKLYIMVDVRDKIAAGWASADELADDRVQALRDRYESLLKNPEGRVPELFEAAGVPLDVTLDSLNMVPMAARDDEYMLVYSSLLAAAERQAWLEIYLPEVVGKVIKYSPQVIGEAKDMSDSDLKRVAKEGISKEAFDGAKTARKVRTVVV
jgi:hypothetical protein